MLFVCQTGLGRALRSIDSVKRSRNESAPGAFAAFVGCFDDIQPRLQSEGLAIQLAEGGGHRKNLQGSTTS